MACKGTCTKHKANKPFGKNRYTIGQKMCSTCGIFIYWDGKHCPCCNFVLRTKHKGTKTRHQLMMVRQIKRI